MSDSQTQDQNGHTSIQQNEQSETAQPNQSQNQNAQTSEMEAEFLQLKQELEATQKALEETKTKLQDTIKVSQHALADLQNYKRRAEEEKQQFVQYANIQLLSDFLPAINNLDRALQHEPKDQEWLKGVSQTIKQFSQILEKHNVKTIETLGKPFDPRLHEALMMGPGEQDVIIEEFEKGYMIGERVIKPARVKVGNGEVA